MRNLLRRLDRLAESSSGEAAETIAEAADAIRLLRQRERYLERLRAAKEAKRPAVLSPRERRLRDVMRQMESERRK